MSLFLLAIPIFFIASCTSVSDETFVNAGCLILQHKLNNHYSDEFNMYGRGASWLGLPASQGKLDPDRMPEWAAENRFVACVYWEDEFETESYVSRPGPDLIRIRHGAAWGWVLLAKDLSFHILETNLSWTVTEDGVETESVTRTYFYAWDAPEQSDEQ